MEHLLSMTEVVTAPPTTTSTSGYPPPQAALTTIFTPPKFCGDYVDPSSWISSLSELHLSSCFPGFPSIEGLYHSVYYSPGICPAGYTVDCMRFDDWQGPETLSGETAAICCPSSFHCHLDSPFKCISSARSTSEEAIYVQIRWQESDLTLLETPPLTNDGPTSRRHGGWGPDGALLSVYTFPPDCVSSTAKWLFGSHTTCQPLTGDYYSPAICPEGWTAAYTRSESDEGGPPIEVGETAYYCCPSGLSSAFGYGCGVGACVSTSIYSVSTGFSIDLVMSREAIQIRWESSDLSRLQTHPLTPGLTLATNFPTATYDVLPELNTQEQLGLGLAFIPIAIAIFGVLIASVVLQSRRRGANATAQPQSFRPALLTRRAIFILISIMVSAIVLIEMSCHILPRSSEVSSTTLHETRSLTKVYVSEEIVKIRQVDSNATYEVTCEGGYSLSYVTATDGDMTVTETYTIDTDSQETEVCRVEGQIVDLPDCYEPPTAPPEDDFLNATSSAVKEGYVLSTILPPLAAAVFAIPWKILALHASSLEPFRQVAKPYGAHMSSFLRNYDGLGGLLAPLPAMCWVLSYTTAAVAPLAAEGWKVKLQGECQASNSDGCSPVVVASTTVIRVLEAVLALNILLAIGLVVILSRWSILLRADPRSILGVASLSHCPEFLTKFSSFPEKIPWYRFWESKDEAFSNTSLQYGYYRDEATGQQDFGILVTGVTNTPAADKPPQEMSHTQHLDQTGGGKRPLKIILELGLLTLGLMGLLAVLIFYKLTPDNQAVGRFLSSQSFGPRFVFSLVGVVINFFWTSIFTKYLLVAPYLELARGPSVASKSIALPYAADSFSYLFSSASRFRFLAFGVALGTIFSDFLPLLLAIVPFDRTTTWQAYVVATWVSVGLIGYMIGILLILIGLLLFRSHSRFISMKELHDNPLFFILHTLNGSANMMGFLHSLTELDTKQRNKRIEELNLRYILADPSMGGDQVSRLRIEVYSANYR